MSRFADAFGPHRPEATYVAHALPERTFDTGEVSLNFAVAGTPDKPALLLIPGQSESWWGYEQAMPLLAERFQVFAVDLRGQGRSSRTPGRYTLDNMGNDLVRFLDGAVGRPAIVSGLSSGGVAASCDHARMLATLARWAAPSGPAPWRRDRVPVELHVVVGVDVDEARRDDRAVGVDHPLRRAGDAADPRDAAISDGDVGLEAGHAAPVHHPAAADHEVEGHRGPSCAGIQRTAYLQQVPAPMVARSLAAQETAQWPSPPSSSRRTDPSSPSR
jgi:pimeloyl-ACP methyl ester carboxylesterase